MRGKPVAPTNKPQGLNGATCHTSQHKICDAHPLKPGTICWRHLPAKQARANALVRHEFFSAIPDVHLDYRAGMLRLASQADQRARLLAELLDDGLPEDPDDIPALIRSFIGTAKNEAGYTTGEYQKALLVAEGQERDRAFRFMAECAKANIEERYAVVEEAKAAGLLIALKLMLQDLGVDPNDAHVTAVMRTRLMELESK